MSVEQPAAIGASASSPAAASRWWPWKVCAFLLLAVALSYLDRLALSVVAPIVSRKEELDLDNAELGLLLSAFFYSFALMHLFTGWVFDLLPEVLPEAYQALLAGDYRSLT